jgi:hypothetical protein
VSAAESIANNQNLLKVLYPGEVAVPSYEKSKIIGLMGKDTEFMGNGTKFVVVSIAPGAGGSASFQAALANQGPTQDVKFSLGRKKLYEIGSIDGEALMAGRSSKGAIVDLLKHSMNRSRYGFARSEASAVWGTGGGARGVIAAGSNLATATITLTNQNDGAKFFKGMWIQCATDDGSSATPAGTLGAGLQVQIGSVTRLTNGTATLTLATGLWNQFPGLATGNFIFRSGDYSLYPNGVPGWAPTADPISTDNFLSVNRFTAGDLNYLSGFRVSGGGQPKQSTLIDAGAQAHQSGLSITTGFVNPLDLRDAFKEQSTFKTIPVTTDIPGVGYSGIELTTAIGSVTIMSETDVPKGNFWLLDPKTWTRRSAGDVPFLVDSDGIMNYLRSPTDDSFQYRLAAYFNYENADTSQAVIGTF